MLVERKHGEGSVCFFVHVVYFLGQSLRCEVFWLLLLLLLLLLMIHVPDSCSDRDSTPPMCTYTKHVCFNLETERQRQIETTSHILPMVCMETIISSAVRNEATPLERVKVFCSGRTGTVGGTGFEGDHTDRHPQKDA